MTTCKRTGRQSVLVLPTFIAAGAFFLISGCATTPRSAIDVAISPTGVVSVESKPVTLSRLPAELKNQGATRRTAIYVSVPLDSSPAEMKTLSETLVAGGYPRIMFTKPQKAVAQTADAPSASQPVTSRTRTRSGTSATTGLPRP